MQAEPGSGKSHLVRCLANSVRWGIEASSVDYNMANLQSIEDLAQPLDAIRNLKVIDKLPILFLDEFDSDKKHYPLLLPLLWDGELHIGHRDLKLGKVVVILAGSGNSIEEAIKDAKAMHAAKHGEDGKLVDLLSRINGGEISIPPLDYVHGDRDRRVDKICLTISLLERRFGETFQTVPWSLLKFVGLTKFKYGVRSMAHLIDLLTPLNLLPESERKNEKEISRVQMKLPLKSVEMLKASSLAYHLVAEDGPAEIVSFWQDVNEDEALVRVRPQPAEGDDVPF
jgi:hypothetical protein